MSGPVRRRAAVAGVAVLAATTAVLVFATYSDRPPETTVQLPSGAAVALHGDTTWQWLGGATCERSDRAATEVRRTRGAEETVSLAPVSTVRQLAFADERRGLLVGTDESCRPALAVTDDGGTTWQRLAGDDAVQSASRGGDAVWAVVRRDAATYVVTRRASADARAEDLVLPCGPQDGRPSLIDAIDDRTAWVVCQEPRAFRRLLLRTVDAGRSWERRADARAGSGLYGLGSITSLSFGAGDRAWVLLSVPRCAEGDVRTTTDDGLTWQRLPCPAASLPLRRVLAVDIDGSGRGLLLGVGRSAAVTAETTDGGRSWRLR